VMKGHTRHTLEILDAVPIFRDWRWTPPPITNA
jgi:hypothetical protein